MVRELRGLPIRQNHKTGMFNANDLLKAFHKSAAGAQKRLDSYIGTDSTKEYIDFLNEKHGQVEPQIGFLNTGKKRHLNSTGLALSTNRGRVNGGTWMHPHLFIDFAMWLSVEFKDWAISCVADKLIEFRDEVGDTFKDVNAALTATENPKQMPSLYMQEARMINSFVFEDGKGGHRNEASEEELSLLNQLQKTDVKLINAGHDFDSRKKNLRIFKGLL